MKEVELRLVSELMRNSRRSDRELAKVIGVSQPTIGRMIKKLEKEGIIKEYTMIPDFSKLGYGLLVLTFVKHARQFDSKELDEITRKGIERARQRRSQETIMAERGIGLGYGSVIISYEKDYSSYLELVERLKKFEHLDLSSIQSFIIDLKDKVHYRSLTFSTIARHLLMLAEEEAISEPPK
jgi:DNA-binding Lrp family transcriptional regulator